MVGPPEKPKKTEVQSDEDKEESDGPVYG